MGHEAGGLVGQVIDGRFEVLQLLETGAMGEVYLVRQLSLGMTRAMKVVKADVTDLAREEKRFRREAQVLSRLHHEHIVQVIDFGQLAAPTHLNSPCSPPAEAPRWRANYLVMEYVEGLSAQAAVDQRLLGPRQVLRILRQLADALAHAHAQGIVHRDLKPANILLRDPPPYPLDSAVPVKLVDFGLVRIVSDETLTKITAEEQILGTPRFMAPEQCRCAEVGPPADLYALGGVAFFMLSGTPVFRSQSVLELLVAHAKRRPERLSVRCPELQVAPELDDLIHRCLSKQPDARPGAAEVKELLLRLGDDCCRSSAVAPPCAPASQDRVGLSTRLQGQEVARLSSLIWSDPDDSQACYTPGVRPVLDALFNQISTVVVNLARRLVELVADPARLRAQLEEIERLEGKVGELEMEGALLESEAASADASAAAAAKQQRASLQRRIARLSVKRDEAYRALFELTLELRSQIEENAAAQTFSDLEKLVEQYLRLSGAAAAPGAR